MPKIKESEITEYELTEHEEKLSHLLSPYSVLKLKNFHAELVRSKASMQFDPSNISAYMQAGAAIDGKIELILQLLYDHEAQTEMLNSSTN